MNSRRKSLTVLHVLMACLALLMTIGVRTFMGPCVHDDGSTGMCAAAGQAVFVSALCMLLLSAAAAAMSGRTGTVLDSVLLVGSIVVAMIPGHLVSICASSMMHCRMVMQPAVQVISVIDAVMALICLMIRRPRAKQGRR